MKVDSDNNRKQKLHLEDILTNPKIKDNVISYLTFADMKIMSMVSKNFLRVIRESEHFREKAVLVIPSKMNSNLQCLELKHLLLKKKSKHSSIVNFPWRGLKVDRCTKIPTHNFNYPIAKNLEYLAFIHRSTRTKPTRGMEKVMRSLLSSATNLKHLELDFVYVQDYLHRNTREGENYKLRDVFLDPNVRENLKNLQRLDILEIEFGPHKKYPEGIEGFHYSKELMEFSNKLSGEESPIDGTFKQLASIPKSLKVFNVNMYAPEWDIKSKDVLTLLSNNRETLEEIWMPTIIWNLTEMREIKFPRLKSVHMLLKRNPEDQSTAAAFLLNHPHLEELELSVAHKVKMTSVLFSAFRKISWKIKTLHLGADCFEDQIIDWSFLSQMTNLKDVKMMVSTQKLHGTCDTLLHTLPLNQLESFNLWGNDWMNSADSENCDDKEDNSNNLSRSIYRSKLDSDLKATNPGFDSRIDILGRFNCLQLVKLSLTAVDAVDDVVMHFVSKHFKNLVELEARNSKKLTDVGITGQWAGRYLGTPITNLKGLKKLIIRECPHVTFDGFLKSVRFPVLTHLDYKNENCFASELFVYKIETFNKSLEELSLKFYFEDCNDELRQLNAFALLSILKKGNRRRRRQSPYHSPFYDANHRLVKLWGCLNSRYYREDSSCENIVRIEDKFYYWAHSAYRFGPVWGNDSDSDL